MRLIKVIEHCFAHSTVVVTRTFTGGLTHCNMKGKEEMTK